MIFVVFASCFRLDAPFHLQEETGLPPLPEMDDPPETECPPDCDAPEGEVINTHYVMIGGESASSIKFEDPAGWLQSLATYAQDWSISMRLPTGLPDPSNADSDNSFNGWSILDTGTFWLGLNLQDCQVFVGNENGLSESLSLDIGGVVPCDPVEQNVGIGNRLTIVFTPENSEPASLGIAVYLSDVQLGALTVDKPNEPATGPYRLVLGGQVPGSEDSGIAAPTMGLDQLMIAPIAFSMEHILGLLDESDNAALNTLKGGYGGSYFSLGEGDSCPVIYEFDRERQGKYVGECDYFAQSID